MSRANKVSVHHFFIFEKTTEMILFEKDNTSISHLSIPGAVPDVSDPELGEIGQFLHLNDGVIKRRLQTLSHHVGEDDGHHHGQDVRNLPR